MKRRSLVCWPRLADLPQSQRRGVFLVVAAVALTAVMAFVAMSVDLGNISFNQTKMQNATDAAALAAAMEITHALQTAPAGTADVFAYALQQARTTAVYVANLNGGVYVDPNKDVIFGQRTYNATSNTYTTTWNSPATQVNVVQVVARRDNADTTKPDGQLKGIFSSAIGFANTSMSTSSIAVIDPRDIIVVHDFSRSMTFDSYYTVEQNNGLPQSQIDDNMLQIWNDLQPVNLGGLTSTAQYAWQTVSSSGASATVTFKNTSVDVSTNTKLKTVKLTFSSGSTQTFNISGTTTTSGTYTGSGSNSGKQVTTVTVTVYKVGSTSQTTTLSNHTYSTTTILSCFNLTTTVYPWASGTWLDYINFVQTDAGLAAYNANHLYGGKTFVCYLLHYQSSYFETKDLWKTHHYPFQAIKDGHSMLCTYLTNLGFGDEVGMVSYDTNHRIETTINDPNPDFPHVNISANPITNDYDSINKLMYYKQASYYSDATNMAGGMKDAITLLQQHRRSSAQPAILLMTDGHANTIDSTESGNLPAGWNWNTMFDYNGDGVADYTTSDPSACCTLKYAKQAVDAGYTVHTICVGVSGDTALMQAIAWLGNGYALVVPGGTTISEKQSEVNAAFAKIANAVPPARLLPPSP